MSHDPLCPSLGKGALPVIDLCACRLIARVREDEFSYKGDIDTAYGQGWDEALDAAREALAALRIDYPSGVTAALAAIDALREEQPPPLPASVGVPTKPMWPLRSER